NALSGSIRGIEVPNQLWKVGVQWLSERLPNPYLELLFNVGEVGKESTSNLASYVIGRFLRTTSLSRGFPLSRLLDEGIFLQDN
ncbi:hypothetical protein HAX54_005723, partial [Datura stramonium]|nr:hypothetical protein [Datura stramonium]